MFRTIRDFLFGKKQDLPTFENGVPASGAYTGMPKPEQKPIGMDPLKKSDNEIAVNSQLAEQAKVKAISEPVTAAVEPAKPPRKRKPRTTKPKA